MRMFTCPLLPGNPKLTTSACTKRHRDGVLMANRWGTSPANEWKNSGKICSGCSVGACHLLGHDAPDVDYFEYEP